MPTAVQPPPGQVCRPAQLFNRVAAAAIPSTEAWSKSFKVTFFSCNGFNFFICGRPFPLDFVHNFHLAAMLTSACEPVNKMLSMSVVHDMSGLNAGAGRDVPRFPLTMRNRTSFYFDCRIRSLQELGGCRFPTDRTAERASIVL